MYKIIPTVPTSKFTGHLSDYVADPVLFLQDKNKIHGNIFQFRVAHRKLTALFDPEHIKYVMQENHTNYRKNLAYRKLRLLLGDGLFTSEGEKWLRQRRLAQPAFHKDMISSYFRVMEHYTMETLNRWEVAAKKNEPINLNAEMTDLTLKIITKALLGLDLNKQGQVVEEHLPPALEFMIRRITSMVNLPLFVPTPRHLKFKQSVSKLQSLTEQLLKEDNKELNTLLYMLRQAKDADTGQKMSIQQLQDEVITFFLAGHETSAVTLMWMFYYIGTNPHVEDRIRAEIEHIKEKGGLSPENVFEMPYIMATIKETMRLASPVWILGREALSDDNICGYKISKGDSLIFSPYLIHRNPELWGNAEKFIPERFIPGNVGTGHKFAYFPFGGGPRLCIGQNFAMMEMVIIVYHIFSHFRFRIKTDQHPGFNFSLTLRPKENIHIEVFNN